MTSVERLFALEQFGIKLGLDAMHLLLHALGHPHRRWPSVHVAGTNGKGSVAAMVDAGLRAAGWRVGRYTSPHLWRVEERIAIDGQPVAAESFELALTRVFTAVDRLAERAVLPASPTFFEVSTAAAFLMFADAAVDVAVVEVGLGGRFDATNVVLPDVSAITTIALDHERYLGSTLSAIAAEKAGVAKRGVPLVVGPVPREAMDVIDKAAADVRAPLVRVTHLVDVPVRMIDGHALVTLTTPVRAYPQVRLGLAGAHQAGNAAVAVRILENFEARTGMSVGPDAIVTALRDARWPARLEWLHHPDSGARVLVDAAHNPAGARALAGYLEDTRTADLTLVTSVMADKDVSGVLGPLLPHVTRVIATRAGTPRAMATGVLAAAAARAGAEGLVVVESADPVEAVLQAVAEGSVVLLAGSIYLVGPVRAALVADWGFRPA
jgi:dihydrofolate synthase/folylpolyglutamate synthase